MNNTIKLTQECNNLRKKKGWLGSTKRNKKIKKLENQIKLKQTKTNSANGQDNNNNNNNNSPVTNDTDLWDKEKGRKIYKDFLELNGINEKFKNIDGGEDVRAGHKLFKQQNKTSYESMQEDELVDERDKLHNKYKALESSLMKPITFNIDDEQVSVYFGDSIGNRNGLEQSLRESGQEKLIKSLTYDKKGLILYTEQTPNKYVDKIRNKDKKQFKILFYVAKHQAEDMRKFLDEMKLINGIIKQKKQSGGDCGKSHKKSKRKNRSKKRKQNTKAKKSVNKRRKIK
jgi:hypothetical protein